jgi:hypothetical protein
MTLPAIEKAAQALAQLSDAEWTQVKSTEDRRRTNSAPFGICPVSSVIERRSRRDDQVCWQTGRAGRARPWSGLAALAGPRPPLAKAGT